MTSASRPLRRVAIACALSCLLAACAVGPDYVRPEVPMPARFEEAGQVWTRVEQSSIAPASAAWWQAWNDPELDALQQRAQQANPSIAAAEAAWRQARAALGEARADGRPQVGIGIGQTRNENAAVVQGIGEPEDGRIREIAQAQLSVDWELDLWGRVRRSVEAQGAQARASEHDLAAQRLSIQASVASAYFTLRQADAQVGLLRAQQQANARIVEIAGAAHALGAASANDLAQARTSLDGSRIALDAAHAARARSLHALAALTGQPAADLPFAARQDYAFSAPLAPALLPSELLLRRPDVCAAEARVEAANAGIGAAQAAYFPSLGLSASGGYVAGSMADLHDAPLQVWSVGAQLLGTLFDGGRRRAQKAQAEAGYDGAVAEYRGAVLQALQEVEDALSDMHYQQRQAQAAGRIRDERARIWQRAQHALALGTASERDALDETLQHLQARLDAVDQAAALSQSAVTLYKQVGGGIDEGRTDAEAGHAPADAAAMSAAKAPRADHQPASI